MTDVRFDQATRIYPGNDVPAVDRLDLQIEAGEFMVARRAVRLREDDGAADAGGAGGDRRGRGPDRRPRRQRHPAEGSRRRDGVPELRPVPVPHRRREHRLPAPHRGRQEDRARQAGRRGRRAARAGGPARPQAGPALRRPAPARRDGTGDHPPAERLPDGRAALEPGREAARPDARRHRGPAAAARHDHGLRHARPGRGDDARPSCRGAQGRAAAAVRRAARALRAAGEHVRRDLHRLALDEPLHGPARKRRPRLVRRGRGRRAGARGRGGGGRRLVERRRRRAARVAGARLRRSGGGRRGRSRRSAPTRTSSASRRSRAGR